MPRTRKPAARARRIAVAGSFNLDLVTRVPHLPRTGEAVHATSVTRTLGGKGYNQAVAARRLGAAVAIAGAVGDDEAGREFLAALDVEGIDRRAVTVLGGVATGFAIPIVDPEGRNTIVVANGANAQAPAIGPGFLDGADVLLVQGELHAETTLDLVAAAERAGVPVLLNLAPADHGLLPAVRSVAVLVVNEVEAADLGGADRLRAQASELVVTLGERGADWNGILYPAPRVDAVDTTGAGDAFCAALGLGLAEGTPFEEALRFAVAAGSVACETAGTSSAMPGRSEVERLLAGRGLR